MLARLPEVAVRLSQFASKLVANRFFDHDSCMPQLTVDQAMRLALQHHQAGRLKEAEALYQAILNAVPSHAEAMHLSGVLAGQTGKYETAIERLRRAIAINPSSAAYYFNLAVALTDNRQSDEAIEVLRQCLRVEPRHADALNNLGTLLREKGNVAEAIEVYRQAVQLRPDCEFFNNLSMALTENGLYDEALAAVRRSLELKGDFAEAHWSLALLLLLKGDFELGWPEYEWRWRRTNAPARPHSAETLWDGSDLAGSKILLFAEQGFGDAIQFIRYAPLVAARDGRVLLQCRPELSRLLGTAPGVEQVLQPGDAHDGVHCPLLSLPLVFGTQLETIPAAASYLRADPALAAEWAMKVGGSRRRLRVGLAWAGSATRRRDASRSIALSQLAPLGQVPGVTFFSLQKGDASRQSAAPPAGMDLIDLTAAIADFADTAALIAQLDLVVSVDTSVAHLAGALGKPVWLLLPFWPDWRWMLDRDDSPWYPSARLFRQKAIGEWGEVIERVACALGEFRGESEK